MTASGALPAAASFVIAVWRPSLNGRIGRSMLAFANASRSVVAYRLWSIPAEPRMKGSPVRVRASALTRQANSPLLPCKTEEPGGQSLCRGQPERRETVVKRLAVLLSLVFGLAASAVALAPGAGAVTGVTGICSFPISIEQTRAQGDMGHFPTSGPFTEGFFTGQFFVEITNDLNGNSIEVNASGPGFNLEDGSFLLSGTSIFFLFPGATGDIAGPGIFVSHGPVDSTFIGVHLNTEVLGGTVSGNLCPLLA